MIFFFFFLAGNTPQKEYNGHWLDASPSPKRQVFFFITLQRRYEHVIRLKKRKKKLDNSKGSPNERDTDNAHG